MGKSLSHPARLSSNFVIAAISTVTTFGVIFVVCFGLWASSRIDDEAITTQEAFAHRGVEAIVTRIQRDQISMTVWDAALTAVQANDQVFIRDNLGVWAGQFFGLDEVFILNSKDQPTYAMQGNKDVEPAAYDGAASVAMPMVAQLRQDMAAASAGKTDSTEAVAQLGGADIVTLHGLPAVISVKPIVSSSNTLPQTPGTEFVYVAIEYIDKDLIDAIATQYALTAARFSEVEASTFWEESIPLHLGGNGDHGYLTWTSDRPASRLLLNTAPVLTAGAILGVLLLVLLMRRLGRATRELQVSEAHAQYLAFHDILTGLPNRALFEDRIEQGLARMRRNGKRLALLCLDLDRFKNVNDTLGHPAGDELIRQVAARLQAVLRETDTVARLGGDEFAIIQMDIDSESQVEQLCQRIVATMEMQFDLHGEPAFVGISIGITLSFATATNRTEMLRKADIALYEAKAHQRGGYRMFIDDMDDKVRQRHQVEADLRIAIDTRTQIKLAYQPLFAIDGTTIVGAEALARWDHPTLGAILPETFIGIAEERGLIDTLGEWLLRDACRFALRTQIPWIAVNISPVQFRDVNFAGLVKSILDELGLQGSRLQLEITEGVLLTNPEVTEATLKRLRGYGVRVALDDFGTGYSAMNYLRRYTVDKLKIDRSFVQQLGASEDSDALVRAMVGLARAMRMEVTAEGVETAEQQQHLADMGCQELQGFLMSKPVSEDQLLALLSRQTLDGNLLRGEVAALPKSRLA